MKLTTMNSNFKKTVLCTGVGLALTLGYVPLSFATISNDVSEVAQQIRKITGTVIDQNGEPVIGANVLEKGTGNGVISDINGNFSLNVNAGAVLDISYIGYIPQQVKVTSQTNLRVILQEDAKVLDEVVVVGYGVQKKKLVTGATVQVKGDDIAKLNTVSPLSALQSQTPGVNITKTSGQPGEGFKVVIRGLGTTGNAGPLYIVDGVSRGNIDYLNPADIESLDVLKDAASAAIYGARAANGVVLVTTKKGKTGKASIQYDGYFGVQNVYKKPELLDAQQFIMVQQEGRKNSGMDPINFEKEMGKGDYERVQNGWKGTSWVDEMENKNAPIQSHSLNISGGSERSVYSIGLSYTSQEGIYGKPVEPDYSRYTARVNSEHVLLKNGKTNLLTVGETISYSYSEKSGIAIGNMYYNDLSAALKMTPLMPLWERDDNGNFIEGQYHKQLPGNNTSPNPIGMMVYQHGNNLSKNHSLNGSFYAVLEPIKDLKLRTSFGYNMSGSAYRQFTPKYDLGDRNEATENSVSQSMGLGFGWTWENTLSYDFKVKQNHTFNALIGMSAERSGLGDNMSGTNKSSIFDDFEHAYLDNTKVINSTNTSLGGSPWQKGGLMSYFGRVNYDYKETYMATVVIRADGSSNFAKGKQWGYFPSVSAGWVVTNENWMKPVTSVMDFFKLRASWGQNGNQSISPFQYLATIAFTDNDYYFGPDKSHKTPGSYADLLANPDVTWETSEQWDFGFDARFFNSRLSMAFDYYIKSTKDWLVQAPVLASYGTGAPYINGGDVRNKGFELSLGWRDQINDFSYGANFNISHNKNEVTRIANSEGIIRSTLQQCSYQFAYAQEGYPIGYFYGYKTAGLFQNEAEVQNYKDKNGKLIMPNAQPGDLRFVDLDGNGTIDESDKTMIGKSNPDVNFGFGMNFGYKGFDFSFTTNGVLGNDIFNMWRNPDSIEHNYTTEILGRWHGEGTSNSIPRLTGEKHQNLTYVSDIFVKDGSYWRMSNMTIGYDFKRLFRSLPVEQFRLYFTAQNLFTITGYSGMDPEIGTSTAEGWVSGIDYGFYPTPRTLMVGASIKF